MKHVCGWITIALFYLVTSTPAFSETSCECPKLGCDPCSEQKSIKFFTDKCGPNDGKVKSCARPLCIPIENPTNECPTPPAANSGPREPIVVTDVPKVNEPEAESVANAGKVKVIQGSVSIMHLDGQKVVVNKDTDIREGDTVESSADGAAVVNFEGGNKVHVHPDTSVQVKEFKDPKTEASRKVLLNLIKGKIRNQVEQKYNGKTTYYKVQTKSAIAGVRGTDFVVTEEEAGTSLKTTVETLKGRVIFADLDGKDSGEVNKGEGAIYFGDLKDPKKCKLGKTYKIDAEHLKELDRDSRVDVAKRKAKPTEAICQSPKGFFNQCAWHKVSEGCVRLRCNANGEWSDETHLSPGDTPANCPSTGFAVKDCDY